MAICMVLFFALSLWMAVSAIGRDFAIGLLGLVLGATGFGLAVASVIYHARKARSSR